MSDSTESQPTTTRRAVLPDENIRNIPDNWTQVVKLSDDRRLLAVPKSAKKVIVERKEDDEHENYWNVRELCDFEITSCHTAYPGGRSISEKLEDAKDDLNAESNAELEVIETLEENWRDFLDCMDKVTKPKQEKAFYKTIHDRDSYMDRDEFRNPDCNADVWHDTAIRMFTNRNDLERSQRDFVREILDHIGITDIDPYDAMTVSHGQDWSYPKNLSRDHIETALYDAGCTPAEVSDYVHSYIKPEECGQAPGYWASTRGVERDVVLENIDAVNAKLDCTVDE